MFAAFGTLTDCGLKFTKDGKFRKFGFVGFKCEEDASNALKHFNKSFVDTSRVTVSDKTASTTRMDFFFAFAFIILFFCFNSTLHCAAVTSHCL